MKQKISIFIQARVTSTRLPGKVLKDINQLPSIVYQYNRVIKSKLADHIAVVIPNDNENDVLANTLLQYKIPHFRGEADNVLQRFIDSALYYGTTTIVRINGDCPLISSSTIDNTIKKFQQDDTVDYASTILDATYPLGEHCECFYLSSLIKGLLTFQINNDYAEHVTPLFYNNREIFNCIAVSYEIDVPVNLRLCIDYPEDYIFIKELVSRLTHYKIFDLVDIIHVVEKYPALLEINGNHIKSKVFEAKSNQHKQGLSID